MDAVSSYLIEHEIPFKQNVNFFNKLNKTQICEIDFIIPGAVIEVKESINRNYLTNLTEQINRYFEVLPDTFMMYLYANKNKEDDISDVVIPPQFKNRVKSIHNLDELIIRPIDYYILEPGVIRSFGSLDSINEYTKFINKTIYVPNDIYLNAIAMFDETEIINIKRYDIRRIFTIPTSFIAIHKHNIIKKVNLQHIKYPNKVFDIFSEKVKLYQLKSCTPLHVIANITSHCMKCNSIYYISKMTSGICKHCSCVKPSKPELNNYRFNIPISKHWNVNT